MSGEMQEYTLEDDGSTVTFSGVCLGAASSRESGKTRWSEIAIYRTNGGQYIVHGVGRSLVSGETDRAWCTTCTTAVGVIERLTRREGSVEFMPKNPNKAVAVIASLADPAIHAAYYNRNVA